MTPYLIDPAQAPVRDRIHESASALIEDILGPASRLRDALNRDSLTDARKAFDDLLAVHIAWAARYRRKRKTA
jgi:hypothetical protein